MNNHPNVLVVDDIKDWQLTFRGMLNKLGCEIILAGSLEQAREALCKYKFDLAVLDIRLDEQDESNVDGLNLAEEIHAKSPETKVVIATGYSTQEALRRAWEPTEGHQRLAADFIPKNETESLLAIVKATLNLEG